MAPAVILAWGNNSSGQCCTGQEGSQLEQRPRCVVAAVGRGLGAATPVVAVAAGEAHTLLLTGYGDVYSCGRAREGQLGLGLAAGTPEVWTPVRVEALRPWRVTQVACGSMHSAAVTVDGAAFEWGLLLPLQRPSEEEVWAAKRHGMGRDFQEDLSQRQQRIVAESWSLYLRNSAMKGTAANQPEAAMDVLCSAECHRAATHAPRLCPGLEEAHTLAIVCGFAHTVAAARGGALFAAGYGEKGQLGNGDRCPSVRFLRVALPGGAAAAAGDLGCEDGARTSKLACGLNHTAAIGAQGGELYTWGLGVFGQLGLGTDRKEQCVPMAARLPAPAVQVACGNHHTVVLTQCGQVFNFGHRDAVGGDSHKHRYPEKKLQLCPTSGRQVEAVYAGGTGCFALVKLPSASAAELQAWGYNQKYQLGRYTQELQLQYPGPTAMPRFAGASVRAFSAGSSHCVAVVDAPSSCVLPPEVDEPVFGSVPLLAALRGEAAFDVQVLAGRAGQEETLGAHRSILRARCPNLVTLLRRPETSTAASCSWELDLRPSSRPCVQSLIEYLYTDHCRASITVASELRNLADRFSLQRLRAGLGAVTETESLAEGQRWARSADGRWVQVEVDASTQAPSAASTYEADLEILVLEGVAPEHPEDYLELRVLEADGGEPRTVYAARAVLVTVEFFHACLEGEFAEAAHLRSGSAADIVADNAEAFVLCLRHLATGNRGLLPSDAAGALAVLAEAHRLGIPDTVAAAESALGEAALHWNQVQDPELRQAIAVAAQLYNLPKVARALELAQESAAQALAAATAA